MNVVVFDTLALARKLGAAGFTSVHAKGAASALSEAMSEMVGKRRDLNEMEARQEVKLARVDAAIRADLARVEASLRADLNATASRLTIPLGGMVAASVAIVAALVKPL